MSKKHLDDTTLEVIAETICGGGQGAGGGASSSYQSPGPYRSMSEITAFFRRASVQPRGQSSTRKWFVLESLQMLNSEDSGSILPTSLERILIRLASPQEYRGDAGTTQSVIDHLNHVLQVEGLEIALLGVQPQLREKSPGVAPVKPQRPRRDPPPDFRRLVDEPKLAEILTFRWEEAHRCVEAGAHLAGIVMMGSILEGALFYKAEANKAAAYQAKIAPKDRIGNPRPLHDWGMSQLIDVAHEVGWLQGDVQRFSHALRESRNNVHPYVQRLSKDRPDGDTCRICWQVVRAAVADLLEVDKQSGGAAQP